jgi:cation transport ATPase
MAGVLTNHRGVGEPQDLARKTLGLLRPGGRDKDLPVDQLKPGDHIRVRSGEKVPVDGVMLEPTTSVDESMSPASEAISAAD